MCIRDRKYPVLMYQYSGPGSQQVLDKFSVSWGTYMASQGYIVVCVDGRGTGGRGAEFAKCTYLDVYKRQVMSFMACFISTGSPTISNLLFSANSPMRFTAAPAQQKEPKYPR